MKADYCVVVWAVNLSEQTLFDLPLRHFDLTNDLCPHINAQSCSNYKYCKLVTYPEQISSSWPHAGVCNQELLVYSKSKGHCY